MTVGDHNGPSGSAGTRLELMGFPVDVGLSREDVVSRLCDSPTMVSYLNPLAWKAEQDRNNYLEALAAMDIIVCDGRAVRAALRALEGISTDIISLDYSGTATPLLSAWAKSRKE